MSVGCTVHETPQSDCPACTPWIPFESIPLPASPTIPSNPGQGTIPEWVDLGTVTGDTK